MLNRSPIEPWIITAVSITTWFSIFSVVSQHISIELLHANTLSFRDINVCPLTLQTKQKITIKVCPSIDGSVVTEYMVR